MNIVFLARVEVGSLFDLVLHSLTCSSAYVLRLALDLEKAFCG